MASFLYIVLRGMAIGLLISAPMGPIGMLCIQRTLNKGRWPAFFTGVGAALSDLIYCLLTGLCLSFITDFVETNQLLLQIIGSLVLAAFAFYLFRKNPARSLSTPSEQANTYWKDFVTGFLLTFSNPLILFFIIGLLPASTSCCPNLSIITTSRDISPYSREPCCGGSPLHFS